MSKLTAQSVEVSAAGASRAASLSFESGLCPLRISLDERAKLL